MRVSLWAALGLLAVVSTPAFAETGKAASAGETPTVTIINKGAADAAALPELEIVPAARETAAVLPRAAAVETDVSVDGTEAGPAPEVVPAPPPPPTLSISIDLTRQSLTVSENGARRHTWAISSAAYGYRTPTGTYSPTWMAKMWYSRQYDNAPMPHAIFFHKGVAIHGSYAIRSLGRPASHGCVRLAPKNAAVLFALVSRHGKERTRIVVHGKPSYGSPRVAGRDNVRRLRRGTAQRYLPPSAYAQRTDRQQGYAYAPRQPRVYAQRRGYVPRGLYNSSAYGYGF